ncbi:MAG: hypothetical protein JKY81_08905 [Colwellia sp.]|nr:hypothetical protein [Colwellia sp.]
MNKKLFASALLSAGLLTTNIAFAQTAPNWDLVQASYIAMDIDEMNALDFTGFDLSGSKLINDNIFVVANYAALSDSVDGVNIDFDTYGVGVGYRYGLTNTTDAFVIVSLQSASVASTYGKADETGYGLTTGVRSMVSEQIELTGTLSYVSDSIDGTSETTFSATAFYHINSQFSVGAGYNTSSDASGYSFSARYSF